MSTIETLNKILNNEKLRIRSSYPSKDVIYPLIEIIRTLDYHTFILKNTKANNDKVFLFEKYRFGWSLAFQLYYSDLKLDSPVPLFAAESSEKEWIDQIVQHAGSIQLTQQLLDYCKAKLMEVSTPDDWTFIFNYSIDNPGLEYYEKISIDYYFSIIEQVLAEKKRPMIEKLSAVRESLKDIVRVMHDEFISYSATDDLDAFYSRFAYLYLMTTQIVDDFDESETFGGIPYKTYMDQVEYACRAGIMHTDCCVALMKKTSGKIDLRDILTYGFSLQSLCHGLGEYFKTDPSIIKETVSCLTTTKENFEYHLSYPGARPSPYFQLGPDTLIRSTCGCLDMPVLFLNRELKRKYPHDFFEAVNNRESRFRNELYSFFPEERIIKVTESVIIRSASGSTDIDAILFDTQRNILALFQLKWQDAFSTSMKERFSRISNLIPKSVEWIDKVSGWLASNNAQTILRTLRIPTNSDKIESTYLFVIARHHVHFTNQPLDERAIWASWYQVVESSAKVKDPSRSNPIRELAAKLKFFSPTYRLERDKLPELSDFEFRFADYLVKIKATR